MSIANTNNINKQKIGIEIEIYSWCVHKNFPQNKHSLKTRTNPRKPP